MILLIRNHKNVIRLRAHSNSEEIKFMSAMAYIIEVNRKKKKEQMCFKTRLMSTNSTSRSVATQDLS